MRLYKPTARALLSLTLTGCLFQGVAAGPSIGIAMAEGPFRIDRTDVKGNASLFDGSDIETGVASSKLRIHGGTRLEIGSDSQARVFATHAVLERGGGQLESGSAYSLEARTLRIGTGGPKTIARVRLDGRGAVLVSAVNGPVRVSTAAGVLIANLAPGRNLRFDPQAAVENVFEITGCLLKKTGRFVVVDQTTNQVFEVRGTDLTAELGNRVTVKGTGAAADINPVAGAVRVIMVQAVTQVAPGGCLGAAASVGADPPPGTRATTTEPPAKGVNKAVIAGVVVAAAAGAGIAVAASNKSKSP
jgi:hypothetical protein